MKTPVRQNRALNRFEFEAEGLTAFLEYTELGDVLILKHTLVPSVLRGRGIAGVLTQSAIETARRGKKKIDPQCSYAAAYFKKHAEYADLRVE